MAGLRSVSFLAGIGKNINSFLTTTTTTTIITQNNRAYCGLARQLPFSSRITGHPSILPKCMSSTIQNIVAPDGCVKAHPLPSRPNQAATLVQITRSLASTRPLRQNDQPDKKPAFGEQFSLRLINENGFLSWTRNSYLSAAVGATMLNGANVDVVQHAGILVLLVSGMNMTWGSACHFTNLIRIRDRCAMSRPTLFLNLLGCVIHALLWLFILGYYIHFSGYTGWIRRRRRPHREIAGTVPAKEQ